MARCAFSHTLVLLLSISRFRGAEARGRSGIGPRIGLEQSQIVVGGQAELGVVLGPATLVPSLDFTLGDAQTTMMLNVDFRWYLLPLPDTGIIFYGSAGPTFLVSSGTGVGLSLVVGAHIPMRGRNRYNLEARFGFGDIPDFKVMLGILFQ